MSKTNFRTLLIANWVLVLASQAASILDAGGDAAQLGAGAAPWSPAFAALYYFASYLYFFIFLVSTVGLFAFRRWARPLYLTYYLFGFAFALLPARTVYGRAEVLAGGLFSLASALILALIFFSPVKAYFAGAGAGELD